MLLAVDASTAALTDDDQVLASTLRERGAEVVPHLWGEPVPRGSTVVIRSTWDYIDAPERFVAWLDHLDAQDAHVHNATAIMRGNLHKEYLFRLAHRGVPTVPTRLLRAGSSVSMARLLAGTGWDDLVLKPAVGAGARETVHLGRLGWEATEAHLQEQLARRDLLAQPYVEAIATEGEVSVVAVDGMLTHAVGKRPASGDWRVQETFGGRAELVDLDGHLLGAARRVLAAAGRVPAFARIDLVPYQGSWHLMELELVEPYLWFALAPEAADALASLVLGGSAVAASG